MNTESGKSRLLQIKDLSKRREDSSHSFFLDVPNFKVNHGEFVSVVGASGCGKSTFLDILGLILKPDTSSMFQANFEEGKPTDLSRSSGSKLNRIRRKNIGYILQTGGLLDFLSVDKNIKLSYSLGKKGFRYKPERTRLVSELGILDQVKKYPNKLSGGQRQRASIARALISKPDLILADEPTAALDPERARLLVEKFKALSKERGTSIIMVTHDVHLIRDYTDRVYSFKMRQLGDETHSECFETSLG